MKIATITCHHVYNYGASLQAYALQSYLTSVGHEAVIINYKPDYLSHSYDFFYIPNPVYRKKGLKSLYILAKFPSRFIEYKSKKKKRFDEFESEYLILNSDYSSYEQLRNNPPEADVYIAGSDQIWNPMFDNGNDPAFFLRFNSDNVFRLSYAASFSVSELPGSETERYKEWLSDFDGLSLREKSGLEIIHNLRLEGSLVCDPVFLLNKEMWKSVESNCCGLEKYVLYYDFDDDPANWKHTESLAKGLPVISILKTRNKNFKYYDGIGPSEFLSLIRKAGLVISNSFHAVCFSLIYQTEFYALLRKEKLNTRIIDLLTKLNLRDRIISQDNIKIITDNSSINWRDTASIMDSWIEDSKTWLDKNLERAL